MGVIVSGPYGGGRIGSLVKLGLALILIGLIAMLFSITMHNWAYFYDALSLLVVPGVGALVYALRAYRRVKSREEYVELHNAIWGV